MQSHSGDVLVSLIRGMDDIVTQFVAIKEGSGGDVIVDDSYFLGSLNGQKDVGIQNIALLLKS